MARPTIVCSGGVVLFAAVLALAEGCAPADDAARFREPIPAKEQVALGVPGNSDGSAGAAKTQGLHIATLDGTTAATAKWYGLTRELTNGVDGVTAIILGGIWVLVNTPPTTIDSKKATWGPSEPSGLESTSWRLTVNEVGDAEYDYVLEGQSKNGGNWLTVLTGHGYGKTRPEHDQGWFQADNDAYRTLEPVLGHDYGTTKVTYDLQKLPATIDVALRPGGDKGSLDVDVTHETGGAGQVTITGLTDIDPSKATKLEDVSVLSRWESNGSGRADIVLKNGDLPFTVDATECWSPSFSRVYYKDTVNFEPPTGDPAACALPAATP
jgi:hypothetical protein